jgi:hypothetical protein
MSSHILLATLALALSAVPGSWAAVLFDNQIGSGGVMGIGTGCSNCTQLYATPFTATASGPLGSVTSAWWADDPTDTFAVSLWTDEAGLPGQELESWAMPPLPAINLPLIETSLVSVLMPHISAGDRYWIVVAATTINFNVGIGWALGTGSETLWTGSTPALLEPFGTGYPGLRVESAVPEPATFGLAAALILAAVVKLRWRPAVAVIRNRVFSR